MSRKFVEEHAPKVVELPILKTIKIGRFENVEQFKGVLKYLKNEIYDWALKLFPKVIITQVEKEIDLVAVSVKKLTGKDEAPRREVYEAALSPKFGLKLCEPEDALCLREVYQDQPDGEVLFMGMEPIISDGYPLLFYVHRDGDVRWLIAHDYGPPDNVWYGDNVFVFRRPRKVS